LSPARRLPVLVETKAAGGVCAWSRHGTSLAASLGELLAPIAELGAPWVFDGALIALSDRDGSSAQHFAAFGRAVFGGDRDAIASLHYVAFRILATADAGNIQARPLLERPTILADRFPADRRLRVVSTVARRSGHARQASVDRLRGQRAQTPELKLPGRAVRSWRKLRA
jgi:hypothetical protein